MISHVAEVWVALFAAFVVGSLLGWLIYRWVDRSDFAFHHHETAKPAPRRRSEAAPAPAALAAEARRPAARHPAPRPRPPTVTGEPAPAAVVGEGQLRSRMGPARPADRTGVREPQPARAAAPLQAPRPAQSIQRPPVPQRATESPPAQSIPRPPVPQRSPETHPAQSMQRPPVPQPAAEPPPALSPAARLLRARSGPAVERAASQAPAPATAEKPRTTRSDMPLPTIAPPFPVQHDEPWHAPSEPWPIERRASAPANTPPPPAGRAVILDNHPKHEEIWSSGEPEAGRADEPRGERPEPALDEDAREEPDRIVWQPPPESEPHAELDDDYSDAPALASLDVEETSPGAPGVAPNDVGETVRPPSVPPPSRPDDFKQIKGIGPAFERRLNQLGIYHYAQIAAWSPAEQAWVGNEFGFAGRIERDDWVGQAASLAAREAATASNPGQD